MVLFNYHTNVDDWVNRDEVGPLQKVAIWKFSLRKGASKERQLKWNCTTIDAQKDVANKNPNIVQILGLVRFACEHMA